MIKDTFFLRAKVRAYLGILNLFRPFFWLYYTLESYRRSLRIQTGSTELTIERTHEYAYVLSHLPAGKNIRVLDVGTGSTPFGAILSSCNYLVDCLENTRYRRGILPLNPHCKLKRGDILNPMIDENRYDAVTCISVLEHIEAYDQAVTNMMRVLKPGGVLILTIPYNSGRFIPNSYALPESNLFQNQPSYRCAVYSDEQVSGWCERNQAQVKDQVCARFWSGSFWNSGDRLVPYQIVPKDRPHDHSCLVLQKTAT